MAGNFRTTENRLIHKMSRIDGTEREYALNAWLGSVKCYGAFVRSESAESLTFY